MKKYLLIIFLVISISCLFAKPPVVIGNIAKDTEIKTPCILQNYFSDLNINPEAVLLSGEDGTAAYISEDAFHLVYVDTLDGEWIAHSDSLPPVSNIKSLSQIAVWQGLWDTTLYIEHKGEIPIAYQPFFWILRNYEKVAQSIKNGYTVSKYKYKTDTFPVGDKSKVEIIPLSGEAWETEFDKSKFSFNGYNFFYEQKPVLRIITK